MWDVSYAENRKKIDNILLRQHSYNNGVTVIEDGHGGGFMIDYDGIFNCNNFIEGVDNVE
jgi:hypothetical protein